MSQNWYFNRGLLGHLVLWSQEEAIAVITKWTTDLSKLSGLGQSTMFLWETHQQAYLNQT